MHGPSGPAPIFYEMQAKRHQQKAAELRHRKINNPNQLFVSDLIALWFPIAIIFSVVVFSALAYALMPPIAIDWLATSDQKARWIIVAALMIGLGAWYVRDRVKFKLYPVGEIAFGAGLSVQGVFQQNVHSSTFSLLATIVAFVTGVRMIIDGFKRFDEFKTGWLLTRYGRKYVWRQAKRGLREMRYS